MSLTRRRFGSRLVACASCLTSKRSTLDAHPKCFLPSRAHIAISPSQSGIVYHANYLRFMERGRTNHLRLLGAAQHRLFAEAELETPGFAFVVRSMQIDFFKPARMDDVLDVVTWPVAVKGASITPAQEVRRGDVVLVKAQVRVAFISEGRAQPIPKALRVLMKADKV